MHEYRKLNTVLQLIADLSKPGAVGYSAKQMARQYGSTTRTIYRYLDLLKESGFELETDDLHRYRIVGAAEIFSRAGETFSLEEANLIKTAVMAIHPTHPLHQNLLSKLFAHTMLSETAGLIYNSRTGLVINRLSKAIDEKRQVILENYQSVNSESTRHRLVEPIGFVNNMRYFFAYEPGRHKVLQFKVDRVYGVELLEQNFQHEHRHRQQHPDAFGMNSSERITVELRLSQRAASLLREEFPLAAAGIKREDKDEDFTWTGQVQGLEGIGRFVLGLPGEIRIKQPEALRTYLIQQRQREKIKEKEHKILQ